MVTPVFVGQTITIQVEYRLNGVATDPTLATFTAKAPSGALSTLTYPNVNFTRQSAGLFNASVLVNEAGRWAFRGESAGVVNAVNEMTMTVQASSLS